jgi:hypothetical protein
VIQDGVPAAGVPITWSATQGVVVNTTNAVTANDGTVSLSVTVAAMPANGFSVQGCAWDTVCANWTAVSVGPDSLQISVTSGAGQTVAESGSLSAVTMTVDDGAGHPVQGALVGIYQTVDGWEGVCASERCPSAPVLAKSQSNAMSGADGHVVVHPLEVSGQPETVNIVAVTGTQGFTALSLVKTP